MAETFQKLLSQQYYPIHTSTAASTSQSQSRPLYSADDRALFCMTFCVSPPHQAYLLFHSGVSSSIPSSHPIHHHVGVNCATEPVRFPTLQLCNNEIYMLGFSCRRDAQSNYTKLWFSCKTRNILSTPTRRYEFSGSCALS